MQQYAIVLEGLETVSNLITRYEIMQKLYLEEETQTKDLLQSSIVALYNKILIFLCKAHRHYSRSTASMCFRFLVISGRHSYFTACEDFTIDIVECLVSKPSPDAFDQLEDAVITFSTVDRS